MIGRGTGECRLRHRSSRYGGVFRFLQLKLGSSRALLMLREYPLRVQARPSEYAICRVIRSSCFPPAAGWRAPNAYHHTATSITQILGGWITSGLVSTSLFGRLTQGRHAPSACVVLRRLGYTTTCPYVRKRFPAHPGLCNRVESQLAYGLVPTSPN